MKCKNCNKQIDDDSQFCEFCGQHISPTPTNDENGKLTWEDFKNIKNTDDNLILKAKALSEAIYGVSMSITNALTDEIKKDENFKKTLSEDQVNEHFEDYFTSLLFLFMHLADRDSFSIVGDKKRSIFIDALFLELRETLSKQTEGGIESAAFRERFGKNWNAFQNEYGTYKKLFAEKDESYGGTVFWEFCKRIVFVLNGDKAGIILMMVFTEYITKGYILLNISQLLKEK